MKNYYIFACNPDMFDWEVYLDESMLAADHICVLVPGAHFHGTYGLNFDMFKDVQDTVEACDEDFNNIYDAYEYEDMTGHEEDETEESIAKEIVDTIKSYFNRKIFDVHAPSSILSNSDINTIYNCINEIQTAANQSKMYDAYCKLFEIIYCKPFDWQTIRGCAQGEWAICFYPKAQESFIPYLEAVYFATGTEFKLVEDPFETQEEAENSEEYFYNYTELSSDSDIQDWAAYQLGCSPSEVKVIYPSYRY